MPRSCVTDGHLTLENLIILIPHVSAIFPGRSSDNSMGLRQCCDRIQAWRSSKMFILVTITLGLFAGKIIADLSNFVLMFVYAVL
jgi:hypothetical protein